MAHVFLLSLHSAKAETEKPATDSRCSLKIFYIMSRGQYGLGKKEGIEIGKKIAKETFKNEKVVTSAIAAALAFVGGLIVKGLGNK